MDCLAVVVSENDILLCICDAISVKKSSMIEESETGEILTKVIVLKHGLKIKVPVTDEENAQEDSRKLGWLQKHNSKKVLMKVHLTWSAKRTIKDRSTRE